MAKTRRQFVCRECGGVQPQWAGRCPECGQWDTLEQFIEAKDAGGDAHRGLAETWLAGEAGEAGAATGDAARAVPLPSIDTTDAARVPSGVGELDRVLGGGLVPGSVVLLGGDPGVGKSTLLLQAGAHLARRGQRVLYVTSEESASQTRLRAERLFAPGTSSPRGAARDLDELRELYVLADTSLSRIVEQARSIRPAVCVIDSIQMIYTGDLDASPGTVAQLRRCCTELVYLAKVSGMAVMLVGHVTKDGQLAGPKLLEHLVDVVLSFEGDRHHAHRVVRGIKNRFGTTLEVGLFEMTGDGLCEVVDAGRLLRSERDAQPGSVVCPVMHGSRCVLLEVQALTAPSFLGSAKRRTSGLDANRLAMLIAVLEKHGGLRLADHDVFASAVGGLRVVEPAADLAICLGIAGAHLGRRLPPGTAVVGEVGLGGEVRAVQQLEPRRREAGRLGYRTLLLPGAQAAAEGADQPVGSVAEALETLETSGKATVSAEILGRACSPLKVSGSWQARAESGKRPHPTVSSCHPES